MNQNINKNHQVFTDIDQQHFRAWIELNVNSITWEGRYAGEFERFWATLFPCDILIKEQVNKLNYAKEIIESGPLSAWFQWLIDKLICYCFIYKNQSVAQLADLFDYRPSSVALILRDFFVLRFPHLEEFFNNEFHFGNYNSRKAEIDFELLKQKFDTGPSLRGTLEDEVLSSLEVTLYKDWAKLLEAFYRNNNQSMKMKADIVKKQRSAKLNLKHAREVFMLFVAGAFIIFGLKLGNKWYEDYLVDKITIFEPNFFWLDRSLTFQSDDPLLSKGVDLSYRELEELEKAEADVKFDTEGEEVRLQPDSDVTLTSVDALPKDIGAANLEQSDYEEVLQKGGYRNVQYGGQKAYRVLMTSVKPGITSEKLKEFIKIYNVQKADNVDPGTHIPGGIYFNLFVPSQHLREFLARVSAVEEATILENKTRLATAPGMNKVFIWIKSI